MVTHAQLQYYRHNYGLVCMTGLLGCRWHRYKQSTRDSRKRDLFWYTVLVLTFLYVVFYLYFIIIAQNDSNDLNWWFYIQFKTWFPWFTLLLALICAIFAYFVILLLLALCHVLHGHQLYMHPVHVVFVVIFLGSCIALTWAVEELWHSQWAVLVLSLQITGPWLQLGAVFILTALSWIISRQWFSLSTCVLKLVWLSVFIIVLVGVYISPVFIHSPCITLITNLPPKPKILAHRGASGIAPENTLVSFQLAVDNNVFGIESDLQFSFDGVPFLLHDDTLRRTTNIAHLYPSLADLEAVYFNISQIKELDAGSWFIETNPFGTVGSLSDEQMAIYRNQSVPTFSEFLTFINNTGRVLMLDFKPLPQDHPYYHDYKNLTLDAILESGVDPNKVWWIGTDRDNNIPDDFRFTSRVTKTVAELKSENITNLSVMYSDISLAGIRNYRNNNITTNIYTVNSRWFFSLYWCLGADSVTSDMCHTLQKMESPIWHLPPQSYLILWVTADVLSAVIIITVFIVQRVHLFGTRFSPETLSLNSARSGASSTSDGDSYRHSRRAMKEKLLLTEVGTDIFEPEAETDDVGIESNYTIQSTDGQIMARNYHSNSQRFQTEVRLEQT